tara:strand:- start:580 stop:1122 length:543 start_codon:yes stop_codon:yes gene_type:complete
MGTLFVDNIKQQSSQGSGTITIGASGETVGLASGVVQSNLLTPAFQAYRTSYQSIANNTETKVQNNIELFDTDNAYDNSTNYRFTVPSGKAGKYLIGIGNTIDNVTDGTYVISRLKKNGSNLKMVIQTSSGGYPLSTQLTFIDDASVGDYYESWVLHIDGSTSSLRTEYTNYFWMTRLGT